MARKTPPAAAFFFGGTGKTHRRIPILRGGENIRGEEKNNNA